MLKLNLGSGGLLWEEYVNFDCMEFKRGSLRTNVLGLIEDLPFKSNSFEVVISVHVIEHFTYNGAISVLTDCHRVLKPGGTCIVEGPDIEGCWWYYVTKKNDIKRFIDFIYGGQGNKDRFGDRYTHRWGWTQKTLSEEMEKIGFVIKHTGIGRHHGMGRRDFRVEGLKNE